LERVAEITRGRGFYLAGGTAIALRLGHRRSLDLDWFRAEAFDPAALLETLRERAAGVEEVALAEGTLHARIAGTATSFLQYRYPLLEPLDSVDRGQFFLASLDDLACMKVAAMLQRGERKDYFDLFALLERGQSLGAIAVLFERKFGFEATSSLVRAAAYFDDAEGTPDPVVLWPDLSWQRVQDGLRDAVRRFAGTA
jgi:hypothetical protein